MKQREQDSELNVTKMSLATHFTYDYIGPKSPRLYKDLGARLEIRPTPRAGRYHAFMADQG